jgi:hypothetical protein
VRAIERLASEFDTWSSPGFGSVLRIVLRNDVPPHAHPVSVPVPVQSQRSTA